MGYPTAEGGNKYVVPDINQNEQPTYGHVSQNIWSQNQIYNLSFVRIHSHSVPVCLGSFQSHPHHGVDPLTALINNHPGNPQVDG